MQNLYNLYKFNENDDPYEIQKKVALKLNNGQAYPIYLGKKDKLENCEACKGKGEIVLPDGKSYNCPACFGWGYHQVKTPEEWLIGNKRTITSINISTEEIVYFFSCNGYKADNVFLTLKEAQEEINRRNKLLREKEAIEAKINE